MRVLVTGADGFIGRATIHRLHEQRMDYRAIDLSYGQDVRYLSWESVLRDVDAVIHLAGILGTHELFDQIDDAIRTNVTATARLLEAIAQSDRTITYVGITMLDVWDNIYQATRVAAERIARAFWRHRDVPVVMVRAYNGYGPYQHVVGPQKIIPTFATCAWRGRPIPIWGDGSATVDLVHVDDIARLLVDATGLKEGTLDAGTGVAVTVSEVADHVLAWTGSTAGVEHLPMRDGEHPVEFPLAAVGLGWDLIPEDHRPSFSWDRVRETVEWYREPRR